MTETGPSPSGVISNKIQAIQGLRGISVLLVVFCHLNVPFFENGFIGVDVFFVISGFLITRIMIEEYVSNRKASRRQGWISFLGFYARRVRRIVPVAYFVIFLILAIGTGIPNSVKLLGTLISDSSWAVFFLSNLNYADQATEYFGVATQQSPLLHFWSLAVEEQFYLFWPVFFLTVTSMRGFKLAGIVFNWRNRLRAAMLVVAILSFAIYQVLLSENSPSGYFSSIARFWEFSIGALFSLGITRGAKKKANLISEGLILFLVLLFFLLSTYQIRVFSVFFVLSAGFVLHQSASGGLPNWMLRILENKFLCFIGKISFSLYLVHWPMIVFSENLGLATNGWHVLWSFPAMVLASQILYKEVEERFMKLKIPTVSKRSAARRTRYFPLNFDALKYSSVLILAFILVVNVQVGTSKPFVTDLFKAKVVEPWNVPTKNTARISPNEETTSPAPAIEANIYGEWNKKIVNGLQSTILPKGLEPSLNELDSDRLSRWKLCLSSVQDNPKCNLGMDSAPRKIYIFGDSYALSAIPMIFGAFSDSQFQVITRVRGQCMVPDVQTLDKGTPDLACTKYRAQVNQEIARVQPFLVIAMSLNSNLINGNQGTLKNGMFKEYLFLVKNAENVIVIGETPFTTDPRSCVKPDKNIQKCIGDGKNRYNYRLLTESSARRAGAEYLDLTPWMCVGYKCPMVIENSFVTWDGGHLTAAFSRKLSPLFSDTLIKLGILGS